MKNTDIKESFDYSKLKNSPKIALSDLRIFVDPLDATREFVGGNPEFVTIMVGITIQNRAKFGVIHEPFRNVNGILGKTYFGGSELGILTTNIKENERSI